MLGEMNIKGEINMKTKKPRRKDVEVIRERIVYVKEPNYNFWATFVFFIVTLLLLVAVIYITYSMFFYKINIRDSMILLVIIVFVFCLVCLIFENFKNILDAGKI
jgi:hypothetical protein